MRSHALAALLAGILCATSVARAEEQPSAAAPGLWWNLTARSGVHFSSGKYEESSSTDILYVPAILRAELDAFAVELTVPYIRIHGPAGIFAVVSGNNTASGSHTEEGLGDTFLSAAYTFSPPLDWLPFFELEGEVKFPTADEDRSLGTGQYDYIAQGTATWSINRFVPFFTVGYEFLGDTQVITAMDGTTSGFELHDVFRSGIGGSYQIVDGLYGGLQYDYRAPTSAGAGAAMDLVPFLSWQPMPYWTVDAYATAGLASGSPDAGGGLQLGYSWQP